MLGASGEQTFTKATETERDQLAGLARNLSAARVRELLAIAATWGKG